MNRIIFVVLSFALQLTAATPPKNPCEGVRDWREAICLFAKKNLVHAAWGYEHGIRDYLLSIKLAKEEGVVVDEETLFAAGMLHDMGGFVPYQKAGVDHAVRSTEVVEQVLIPAGFPSSKIDGVKKAILTHSYYDPTRPSTNEAIVLHDADTLDFLGAISVARLFSIVGKEGQTPTDALRLLTSFQATLLPKLYGGRYTQALGKERVQELGAFLDQIQKETFGLGLP